MTRLINLTVGIALGLGLGAAAHAQDSASLRASGEVGEQANGYLGVVGSPPPEVRSKVDAINIKRRAHYTEVAAKRSAKIEEVGATMACDIFANSVLPGQYYRLSDGVWRKREGGEPVPRPSYCGQ